MYNDTEFDRNSASWVLSTQGSLSWEKFVFPMAILPQVELNGCLTDPIVTMLPVDFAL